MSLYLVFVTTKVKIKLLSHFLLIPMAGTTPSPRFRDKWWVVGELVNMDIMRLCCLYQVELYCVWGVHWKSRIFEMHWCDGRRWRSICSDKGTLDRIEEVKGRSKKFVGLSELETLIGWRCLGILDSCSHQDEWGEWEDLIHA